MLNKVFINKDKVTQRHHSPQYTFYQIYCWKNVVIDFTLQKVKIVGKSRKSIQEKVIVVRFAHSTSITHRRLTVISLRIYLFKTSPTCSGEQIIVPNNENNGAYFSTEKNIILDHTIASQKKSSVTIIELWDSVTITRSAFAFIFLLGIPGVQ